MSPNLIIVPTKCRVQLELIFHGLVPSLLSFDPLGIVHDHFESEVILYKVVTGGSGAHVLFLDFIVQRIEWYLWLDHGLLVS